MGNDLTGKLPACDSTLPAKDLLDFELRLSFMTSEALVATFDDGYLSVRVCDSALPASDFAVFVA